LIAFAQEQGEVQKAPPATKLEAFSARTGIVLVKGYTTLGTVNGMGRVSIDVREFRDASNPKSVQYGVAFEVKESGRLERENTSFIDEDEIDPLIRGLDYISKIDVASRRSKTLRRTTGPKAICRWSYFLVAAEKSVLQYQVAGLEELRHS
jgi:hypothetical protein